MVTYWGNIGGVPNLLICYSRRNLVERLYIWNARDMSENDVKQSDSLLQTDMTYDLLEKKNAEKELRQAVFKELYWWSNLVAILDQYCTARTTPGTNPDEPVGQAPAM